MILLENMRNIYSIRMQKRGNKLGFIWQSSLCSMLLAIETDAERVVDHPIIVPTARDYTTLNLLIIPNRGVNATFNVK
jgi:hypothetical protein